jgi:hypothetical protein
MTHTGHQRLWAGIIAQWIVDARRCPAAREELRQFLDVPEAKLAAILQRQRRVTRLAHSAHDH